MSTSQRNANQPKKMIDFIEFLYSKFKILNKLSQKQSNEFQSQVVTLLVDSNENVDWYLYEKIQKDIGLQQFVLQTLGNIINRNPFKNQFQLNRNLAIITENIKKDQEELIKKQKIIERKQQKIKLMEDQILANLKQKILALQNQSIQKINKKQNQIKKSFNLLFNQLKNKQKIIVQKYQNVKLNLKIAAQLQMKEKAINQKIKIIQKKQKQLKNKDLQISTLKKDSEIQEMKETSDKLKSTIRQINQKYKNLQLAYRKLKNDFTKKQIQTNNLNLKKQIAVQSSSQKQNVINLDQLQLSTIQHDKVTTCLQLVNHIHYQQISTKIAKITKNICNLIYSQKIAECPQLDQLKNLLNITQKFINKHQQSEQQDSYEDLELQCLIKKQPLCQFSNQLDHLLSQISNLPIDKQSDKISLIKSNKLFKLIQKSRQFNMSSQICQKILQLMIQLVSSDENYEQIINYISSVQILSFLQNNYLYHQTNQNITETATLLISRIKLKNQQIKLDQTFLKALQIRLKVQNKSSFLYGNINSILN